MRKLALFDFCDTIVGFQTADAFVDYARRRKDNTVMKSINFLFVVLQRIKVFALLNRFFPGAGLGKKVKLMQLRGLSYNELDNLAASFYKDIIRPAFIKPVMDEMRHLQKQGFDIGIVSAGYSIYLKYFAEEYHVEHLIATEICFGHPGNLCRGTISGEDCMHDEKVIRIQRYFQGGNVNYKESISYSDSKSDLPLLKLTGTGVVVSHLHSQIWSRENNLKEIIWS